MSVPQEVKLTDEEEKLLKILNHEFERQHQVHAIYYCAGSKAYTSKSKPAEDFTYCTLDGELSVIELAQAIIKGIQTK